MPDEGTQFKQDDVIGNRWKIVSEVGAGAFGRVYVADDPQTGVQCAIKVGTGRAMQMEVAVMRALGSMTVRVCRLIGNGAIGRVAYVAMTLLGQNLHDLRRTRPTQSLARHTVARLALQCLDAIKVLHEAGYVHRDIKPANFVMGRSPPSDRIVHIIDFGMARAYRVPGSNAVAAPKKDVGFRGTKPYASIAAHLGQDLGRRDDMCSLLYVLVELWKGRLPWSGVKENDRLMRKKRRSGIDDLTHDMERQYNQIGTHVINLKFADQPDYADIQNLLKEMQRECSYPTEGPFEWET